MASILLLDKEVAELIAAGEVIDRPASAVKELVENAIDAGATAITVEIQSGGVTYIRVTDNGGGIAHEDIPKAFWRHATSKLSTEADLECIRTLGFRGEALASIAAMCRVELLTKTPGSLAGSRYVIEGGVQQSYGEAGCPDGTTIIVRDIFFNTPARMKFLKKDTTEGNYIAAVLDRVALSHPEIAFKFISGGQIKLQTPGDGQLYSAILAVFGRDFAEGLIPVEDASGPYRVTGYICKPEAARQSRSMQVFFINGRFVRSKTCGAALDEAYKRSLMVGKFPSCVLHVELPHSAVDVNAHPAKTEVRFADERALFDCVYGGCKSTLSALGQAVALPSGPRNRETVNAFSVREKPTQGIQQRFTAQEYREAFAGGKKTPLARQPLVGHDDREPLLLQDASLGFASRQGGDLSRQMTAPVTQLPQAAAVAIEEKPEPSAPVPLENVPEKPMYERYIGELFDTYILLEMDGEFLLVDKHAAHERILYEQIAAGGHLANRQMLLAPVRVTMAKALYSAAVEHIETIRQLGIEAEDFGEGTLLVREVPVVLDQEDISDLLLEIASKLRRGNRDLTPAVLDELYHSIACKAAIKGGQKNSAAELEALVRVLRQDPSLRCCPHGRPIVLSYQKRDLERMFGRA